MARLIDDNGRLFGKVSVVDLIVLAVIVALAVFVGLRVSDDGGGTDTTPVKLTFVTQPSDPLMVDAFLELGPLKDKSGRLLGTIEEVELQDAPPVLTRNAEGEVVEIISAIPQVVFIVATEGHVSTDGVHVGGVALRAGTDLETVGPGWEAWVQVVKVEQAAVAGE